jgi:hypothetical protein
MSPPIFEVPSFSFSQIFFTGVGAVVYWSVRGRKELKCYGLPGILQQLPGKRWHPFIELALFVVFGCIVGIAFTDPANPRQAITAGMGWTGVFTKRRDGN